MKRFFIVVMDSVGCGALPDAEQYNSQGANTLAHIASASQLQLPFLQTLGLGNILPLAGVPAVEAPCAAFGKMASRTAGKDTTSGHWEIAGLVLPQPLPTYPQGFPPEVLEPFTAAIGCGVLGNCVASGTEIIQRLGEDHLATRKPIVYTSADSVFQVAAHETIYPPERLYEICRIARRILQGPHGVGRVIARPFLGHAAGDFYRTENRRDFSLPPPPHGLLQAVREHGLTVTSIGKIRDIFAGQDVDISLPGHTNAESMQSLCEALATAPDGLVFANFVDFDMLFGHRNDPTGYASALMQFDSGMRQLLPHGLQEGDILAVTADHGNDPTTPGTDHDREYVPLLVCGAGVRPKPLGIRASFADLGQTAAEYLGATKLPAGESFLAELLR